MSVVRPAKEVVNRRTSEAHEPFRVRLDGKELGETEDFRLFRSTLSMCRGCDYESKYWR